MTFKRVNDFATDNPGKLDRELSQLESNIDAEFVLARKELAPQLQVVTFRATAARPITAILPDQQLSVTRRSRTPRSCSRRPSRRTSDGGSCSSSA